MTSYEEISDVFILVGRTVWISYVCTVYCVFELFVCPQSFVVTMTYVHTNHMEPLGIITGNNI